MAELLELIATPVAQNQRLLFLPRMFAGQIVYEQLVYHYLESICAQYNGGSWEFYELSNGGRYMAPRGQRKLELIVPGNYFRGHVSCDAAGIIASLHALSVAAFNTELDDIIESFHRLRDYALNHDESDLIMSAIN